MLINVNKVLKLQVKINFKNTGRIFLKLSTNN